MKEKELVDFLVTCSKLAFGNTRVEVFRIVNAAVAKKGRSVHVSSGWWPRFIKHWPVLSLRMGDTFSIICDRKTRCSIFESYFSLLGETLDKHA